jgi:hypothetical protein
MNIQTTIASIVALLPTSPDPVISNNIVTLRAELAILARWADYAPALGSAPLWEKLGSALYRYMPLPTYATWCQQISTLVTTP